MPTKENVVALLLTEIQDSTLFLANENDARWPILVMNGINGGSVAANKKM